MLLTLLNPCQRPAFTTYSISIIPVLASPRALQTQLLLRHSLNFNGFPFLPPIHESPPSRTLRRVSPGSSETWRIPKPPGTTALVK